MILTYDEIVVAMSVVDEIEGIHLPMRYSLRVALLLKKLREYAALFNETRSKIIEAHGITGNTPISNEKANEVNMEIALAAKEEIEISYEPIDISLLDDKQTSVKMIERTMWMWRLE